MGIHKACLCGVIWVFAKPSIYFLFERNKEPRETQAIFDGKIYVNDLESSPFYHMNERLFGLIPITRRHLHFSSTNVFDSAR